VLVRPFAGDGVRISVGETEATDDVLRITADWLSGDR
jgi:histidinol-phosphate aminotransferase